MGGTAGGAGLLDTVVKLVNLGFAGVGVVVLLLLFIILMRDKPVDDATQRLRNRFLTWGMSFAAFCGLLAFIGPLVAPAPASAVAGKPAEMLLSFSPRFDTEMLPAPSITLPDGRTVAPGTVFPAQSGQVLVSVDEALKSVAALKQAALTLADTAKKAQNQADEAVARAAESKADSAGEGEMPAPVASAAAEARADSQASQAAATSVAEAIRTGDFRGLEVQRRALDTATTQSIRTRARVIRSF